jgi:hypothetical protein
MAGFAFRRFHSEGEDSDRHSFRASDFGSMGRTENDAAEVEFRG